MKTKVIVIFSTNRKEYEQKKFRKEIDNSIGLKKDLYQIIVYDNHGDVSLTQAYNYAWNALTIQDKELSDYILVFCHHDIHFKTKGWGKNLLNIYNNNEVDIIGLAGTDTLYNHGVWWLDDTGKLTKKNLWGKVWHTDSKKEWKSDFTADKKSEKLQPVVAIDGVFMVVNPTTCFKFDEDFDGFHYYDISFCVDNFLFGKKIAVTETIQIVHESGGVLSEAWEKSREKLVYIYEKNLPIKIHK